ncbi:cytidine deaminase [Salinisphaera sp. Q1T1-3]|uniref:cytidine deaminase n=1 Tax=Salinisphaera sp. Q1T1-3 TaxID=2321229 RepID=UPI000E72DB0B|nr:cytidine deaminase [Salinisphaera sp. Q1T1-3]RJS93841.1 cytidine deaminase [Salinisphaera sp. Q1T1-3]
MPVDKSLVDAARTEAIARWGRHAPAGAAAVYLADGCIVTSVGLDTPNEAANLCHETGAYCEAFRRNLAVIASACVIRLAPDAPFTVVATCGLCIERLAIWRDVVEVAVPRPDDASRWQSIPFHQLSPHYWASPIADGSVY